MGKKVTRLFEQFQPEHYELHLVPDREAMTFSGTVTVRGRKMGRPAQRLSFHQKELKITSASIIKHDKKGDQSIKVSRINNQDSFDEVRLHSKDMIYPGEYSVTMQFQGEINVQMHGIYPCFYKHDGRDKKLIATQFESHHAREAFPCIDEPEAKATFDLSLVTPAGETALANTPVKNEKIAGGLVTTVFVTSLRMSTYLLAFVYGEMHAVQAKSKNGTLVSSWATVAQPKEFLNYANTEAVNALEFFEEYFDTPFPLSKFDQVALPDFESLAMENWGLVTFREVGLLADPKNRSLSGEQLITMVVAHEMSHQWFGNLVTMKWWDDLWLNESFASIMETLAPDRLHPDWHVWEDFISGRALSASNRDIYKDVQAVAVDVNHPDEITTLFDPAIVYAKGARLLKMLYEYIGEDAFRAGLKSYFKKHAYGNTSRDDLWQAFSDASKQDISTLMTPWLQQSGMPRLNVQLDGSNIKLSQQRFLLDSQDEQTLWPIPLLAEPPVEPAMLQKRSGEVPYNGREIPVFNINGDGHFIVSYQDDTARQNVKTKVIERTVGSISRVNLLNDMLLLTRHGDYPLSTALDIAAQCQQEPRDAVWSMFMRAIGFSQTLTDGDLPTEKHIRHFKAELSSYWYEKLGWNDKISDDPNTKHLRTTALALNIAGENSEALKTALAKFDQAGSVEKLPADQRAIIAGAAVRFGPSSTIEQLMTEYTTSHSPDVQESIASALCSTRDPEVGKKIISWGLSDEGAVRQQDLGHWYAFLMRNHYTRELAWAWLVTEWQRLHELFAAGKHMDYFIWYASGPMSTPEWAAKFEKFFKPKMKEVALQRNIQIGLSEIAARVAWRQREEADLKTWFKKRSQ